MMKIIEISAGDRGVYIILRQGPERSRVYAVNSSAKKFTAQMEKVDIDAKSLRHVMKE